MANDLKTLEIKVGLFVLIGLVIIAVMAVQFGRVGQGLTDFYTLTVNFPNASGLVKNADVQLSGARIGVVAEAPKAVPGQIGIIPVQLKIRADLRLPKDCFFMIGKSGLLGDTSVMVALPTGFDLEKFDPSDESKLIPKNSTVKGTPVTDFNELASQGEKNMRRLSETLEKIQNGVLSDDNMNNLQASFTNIKALSDNLSTASAKIGPVLNGAEGAVNTAKETFTEAKAAMVTINSAAGDVRIAIADIRAMVKTGEGVLKQVQTGNGTIPMLLRDPQVADDFRSVIYNLRRHGVLFYRDSAPSTAATQPTVPASTRKTR